MKVLITSPRGKERLVQAFKDAGAEVVTQLSTSVKLIVPTVDEELPFFASAKGYFVEQGISVMVGSEYTIQMCRDKAEFYRFCRRHAFETPVTSQFEAIVKPRFGKAGKGQFKIDRSYIVQQIISSPEYSVDYFALGNTLSIVPRLRLGVVNGESTKGQILMEPEIIETCKRLGNELQLEGHNVIQGFFDGFKFIVSEVNPRFGGGSWITFGVFNSPKYLLEHYETSRSR